MKNLVRSALLIVAAAWFINTNAAAPESASEQAPIQLRSSQLSPNQAEDIRARDFENIWIAVGKDLGYPKIFSPKANDSELSTIRVEYVDSSWLSADFAKWDGYNNKMRFYLSGYFTKYQVGKGRKLTPEDFKSFTMGYYQCVNALTTFQKLVRENQVNVAGSVEDTFKLCGISRVVGSSAD